MQNGKAGFDEQALADVSIAQAQTDRAEAFLTEREKALLGQKYHADDDRTMVEYRLRNRRLCQRINDAPWPERLPPNHVHADLLGDERRALIEELFFLSPGQMKKQKIYIEPPIFCDYGFNVKFEGSFYANTGITVLDDGLVIFGDRCILAPGVQILGTTHSVTDMQERRAGYQRAHTIRLGKEVWIGAGAILLGPCEIGDGCIVGAGAVCKGKLEPWSVYGGVPAKLIRRLEKPADA